MAQSGRRNEVRIGGGNWRGRKLPFPDAEGLRPTPDRVRETLFNWLRNSIYDARCLDLFAGSGALTFEALSRGAKEVVCVESERPIVETLRKSSSILGTNSVNIVRANAEVFLSTETPQPFDIVFLDPPFQRGLLQRVCPLLEARGWLSDTALIYLEAERDIAEWSVPPNWQIIRDKSAGQVRYALAQRNLASATQPLLGETH